MLTGSIETQRTASHKASSRTPVRAMWTLSLRLHVFTTRVQFSSVYVMWTKPKSSCHRDERWQRTCWVEVSPDICHWRRTGWSRVHSRWTELKFANLSSERMLSNGAVNSRRTELNWTDLHQVDPVTRRVIGHTRQHREVDWLQGCRACIAVQFSSDQFVCCEHGLTVTTAPDDGTRHPQLQRALVQCWNGWALIWRLNADSGFRLWLCPWTWPWP